jgi:hypothetical protein
MDQGETLQNTHHQSRHAVAVGVVVVGVVVGVDDVDDDFDVETCGARIVVDVARDLR